MKVLMILVALVFVGCVEVNSGGDNSTKGVTGIDKSGTWVPASTYIECYTDSSLDNVDASSGLTGGNYKVVVNGNKATETISDGDCSIVSTFDVVVSSSSVEVSNVNVVATPSPCEVTFNYPGLSDVTTLDASASTGQIVADNSKESLSSNEYFIMRDSNLETGSKVCLSILGKQ